MLDTIDNWYGMNFSSSIGACLDMSCGGLQIVANETIVMEQASPVENIMSAQPNTGMQPTTFENPMGVDGFEFVEFAAPDPSRLHDLFKRLGFTAVAKHKNKAVTLYRQGGSNFLVNEQPDSFASDFVAKHGPCACGFAIRFSRPASEVLQATVANGAKEITHKAASRAVD